MHNDSSSITIQRKAIEGSDCLGSFYDCHFDCIVQKLNLSNVGPSSQLEDPVRCEIISGNTLKSQNLLQMTGIQDNLRLNILLNLAPRTRVASIINHPYPIDDYTRFIHYSYENRQEHLPQDVTEVQKLIGSLNPKTEATHIITGVSWGIDVVVVLKLPADSVIIKQIDAALNKAYIILNGNSEITSLTLQEESLFRQHTQIIVYSNVSFLNRMTSVNDICHFINNRNEKQKAFRPLTYTLKPIQLFYPQFTGSGSPLIQLDLTYSATLEQYLLQYVRMLKDLKYSLDYELTRSLCGHLAEQLRELQQQWVNLKNMQTKNINRLKTLVSDIRHGRRDISAIDEALREKEQINFFDKISGIPHDLEDLTLKGHFITDLKRQQFEYCNVAEYDVDQRDTETTIIGKLISNDQYNQVICSNDTLNKKKLGQLRIYLDKLAKERKKHPDLRLIYADFSYCSFELTKMMILPSTTRKVKENNSKQKQIPSSTEISMPSSNTDIINILLLGESGVGKSTFINALANYLAFDKLQQAQSGNPMVLIPVSFLITTGHNFEERTIKFGDVDSLNNEDFDHPGQSVTQYCKSYVFHMNRDDRIKLRIIDTPGFGDTRGLDQDDRNMQHILEYVTNLSHLNAICFLLKPNESQLHIFLRQCFTRLFDIFGPDARNNIIFCFTNARSTFYTPGDTAPLLKKMLSSFTIPDVPFKKENTFCFDNESFRYLVALRNDIQFSDEEKHEYEMSWSTSVTQSNHLIEYIHKKLPAYYMDGELQSMKRAQLEIAHMIRPMLEAMRNILRNLILHTMHNSKRSFNLHPKAIPPPVTICTSCAPYPLQVGSFWIVHNIPHKGRANCYSCLCSLDQHIPIDYIVEYEFLNKPSNYDENQFGDMLQQLCHASVDLGHFLLHTTGSSETDPFFIGLVRMITEEKYLRDNQKPNDFNVKLVDDLRELQKEYDKRMNFIIHNQRQNNLSDIYKLINTVRGYPSVYEQLAAAKEGQRMMMQQYEHEVPKAEQTYL
jgi:GTP-binding protein EngB required for normal cell division